MGQCYGKPQKGRATNNIKDIFPDHYTESQICDYYVDRLPSRLVGDGIHLLRGGPGPIMQGWTQELLNDAGVHSYQDRELLLKTRDEILDAVEAHRQRLRQLHPPRLSRCSDCRSRTPSFVPATEPKCNSITSAGSTLQTSDLPSSPNASTGADPNFSSGEASPAGPSGSPADKAAARQAEQAAAAAAAEATSKATAFSSDGDGKSFRLTTDWLPAGVHLYRISEEFRHMASSGTLDAPAHTRAAGVLDGPAAKAAASVAAAAAAGGAAPLQTRAKSRFSASTTSGDISAVAQGEPEADCARDDDGCVQDRDADEKVVATAIMAASAGADAVSGVDVTGNVEGELSPYGQCAGAAVPGTQQQHGRKDIAGAAATGVVEAGGACSCDAGSGSSHGSGEDSGSAGSRSPGSTLGAESLAALTSLDPPPPPSPPPPPPSLLVYGSNTTGAECVMSSRDTTPLSLYPADSDSGGNCHPALESEVRQRPGQQLSEVFSSAM